MPSFYDKRVKGYMKDKTIDSVQNYKYWVGKWLETQGAKLDWAMSEVDKQPAHRRIPQAIPMIRWNYGTPGEFTEKLPKFVQADARVKDAQEAAAKLMAESGYFSPSSKPTRLIVDTFVEAGGFIEAEPTQSIFLS
ncbi:hypothetical protein SISNIDRAFT_467534 [Sistotremastrum niveocremeum HHB9708]|uniref:Uncharacterized protein n=1 Tax=Sistotremastrum niveocremeum HHB9708 TaxID=1314777 RepID=A0A164SLJ1_9AGAM|nr:hypothetical protein SISNIDRAFT_467534 [Sistotremastrum niveocremeum HHB9708]